MASKCRIPRSNAESDILTDADLANFAMNSIMPSLMEISSNQDYYKQGVLRPDPIKRATVAFLQSLGQSYYADEHENIVKAIEMALSMRAFRTFKQIIPPGKILEYLKLKGTAETASAKISTDQIMDDDTTDYDAVDYFLNNAYGPATLAKRQLLRKMNNTILNSFIIDRKQGVIVSNMDEALHNVEQHKKQLFNDIKNYFDLIGINLPVTTEDIMTKSVNDLVQICKSVISQELQVGLFTGSELQEMYDYAYNNKTNDPRVKNSNKLKLDAYGSWLALQHFDNFIKMTVGDTIIINPSDPRRYSYSTKGTNINTTWRKDDNIDLQAEINKLTQALINTSPMMQFGQNQPIDGSYMQFSDFSYITTKVKDLVYNQVSSKFILDKQSAIYSMLTPDEQRLVNNKSLRQVISHSRYNPQTYLPLIFKILTTNYGSQDAPLYIVDQFGTFNKQDKNLVWSIFKNIYQGAFYNEDSVHSLYAIQKENSDSKNYYAAVSSVADCMFSVDFAQYVFDNGILKLRTLRDAAVDKTRKEIERVINTKNSSDLIGNFDFSQYNVAEHHTEGKLTGITFDMLLQSGETLYIHVKDMGESIVFSKNPNPEGAAITTQEMIALDTDSRINLFYDEVLGLNLSNDAEFRNTYKELTKEGKDSTTPFVKQVLGLASHVFFNRYFAQNYLDGISYKKAKTNVIKEYFTDEQNRPRFNNSFFNMEMVPRSKYNTLLNLAQALGTTRGINSSRQVKDSDNAMLSSQTLSRLLGNMVQQLDVQIDSYNKMNQLKQEITNTIQQRDSALIPARKQELQNRIDQLNTELNQLISGSYLLDNGQTPAAANFSLIKNKGLFKGILKSEEIKGVFGNKKQVKFTTAEAVISSFLHNFVLGHCNKNVLEKNSELGGGIVGLLPSVNSDKTTVSIAKFDLNTLVDPHDDTTYMDLSNPEIVELIQQEIGDFYNSMYNNITQDFKLISNYVQVNINPENNFAELNALADKSGKSASDLLFEWTNAYNLNNPTKPIRLIDQIHYIKSDNHIKFNNTINDLRNRFNDSLATQEFFKLKNSEVLKSALDSEFIINLYGNSNLDNQPEINYLRENYGDWINDSGQMILARVTIENKIFNIANKSDLLAVEKVLTIKRMTEAGISNASEVYTQNPYEAKIKYGCNNLSTKMHLLKDTIELHPMLEKYNLMDYLFTQQIMCSTVGSHVAHPAKGKFNKLVDFKQLYKDGYFKSSNELNTKLIFVDEIQSDREVPVVAQLNREGPEPVIYLNENLLRQKYEAKVWTTPAKLTDGTFAEPLPLETFNSFEEFATFVLEHESAHILRRRHQGETKGVYETKINNIALQALNFRKQQALLAEEASRFYAQHKRNVSFTAAMDQFQLNQIDGIPLWYNIAIIDDIKEGLFTVDGNTDSAKPYDGATYVNPITMYLENNSLNEAKAGIDKKQFVHFYDEMTGSGGIIKTAGFAVTNDRMRNSIFYRDMMHNMTNKVWKDYQGNDYIADITKNYKGEDVNYGEFYFKKGNKYYRASIVKGEQPNSYIRNLTEVDRDGSDIQELPAETWTDVNTNYRLWEMFGGMHSQTVNGGLLEPSETSLQLVVKAVINTGKVKPQGLNIDGSIKNDITAEYIDQPLKNADIHYMPTIGAVKQGAANMNPKAFYNGKNNLNFFRIRMTNAGIQLDKEHHADNSTLSLMTQVISSACSMGYTPQQASKLYKALYNLTMQGIREFKDGFLEIINSTNPDRTEKFEKAIADCMIKNMITSTAQDGDMLRAIATELIDKARKGQDLTFTDTKGIPYSDPSIFNKLVTNLSVMMTKAGIKAKMNGILSVLCPTHNIVKMYNFVDEKGVRHNFTLSQLEEFYGDSYENIIDKIQQSQTEYIVTPFFDMSNIEIGNKYLVTLNDGNQVVMHVKYPHDTRKISGNEEIIGYKTFKQLVQNGNIVKLQEYVKDGKELGSINYKFKGTNGESYQIWDIDYIQDLFETMELVNDAKSDEDKYSLYKNLIIKYDGNLSKFNDKVSKHFASYQNNGNWNDTKHLLKLAKLYIRNKQQDILFALSKNNPDKNLEFTIDNQPVTVDKNSIQVQPYEIVMPKIFLEEFGLDQYSNLDEIVNNPDYFYDRMVNNFSTKVFDETLYDIELKRTNGNHIYIKDKSGAQPNWNQDLEKVTIYKKVDELGKIWRIDLATNKKMYQLFNDSDEVYRIPGTDIEIIATSNKIEVNKEDENDKTLQSGITFYLNNFKYQSLHISEALAAGKTNLLEPSQRPMFDNIMEMIADSKNRCAQSWMKLFTGDTNQDIEENKQGWKKDRVEFNKELNNFAQLGGKLRNYLKKQATSMHTSLLKSLDIIAARIPAQNQQSFMPMKVVAWENPNVNTAYVSVMQFFLQGSDLDIDAVSLLTHSFSKNGEFHDWSPEFNMRTKELLDLSLNLPFPTGKKLEIVAYDKVPYVDLDKRQPYLTQNDDYLWLVKYEKDKNALVGRVIPEEQKERINAWKEINEKEALKRYANLLNYIEKQEGIVYLEKEDDVQTEAVKWMIDRINKHNTYLNGVSDDVSSGAIKNYLVSQLYSISTDSANLLEAHTGVDVATGPLKKIANESELSEVQKTFTPGNVFNKFQAIEEASVGKDDIAICATGLKAFFASTQFCNSFLNKHIQDPSIDPQTIDNIASIIKFTPVEIGGRRFNSLANIRVDNMNNVNQMSEIYHILVDKGFDEDASVVMSALLSLSTDNAKELCLAKINAGTSMIGMYLYGAAIGMDFDVLNKIIASPLGFTIAKLLNSNEFTLKQGKMSLDAALAYLFDGPSSKDLGRFEANLIPDKGASKANTFELFNKALQQTLIDIQGSELALEIQKQIGERALTMDNIGRVLSFISRTMGSLQASNFLYRVNQKVNSEINKHSASFSESPNKLNNFKAISNQLYDFLLDFVNQASSLQNTKYTTAYGESDIKDDLNKLALGADEFKRLGQFLRLNQEIKTKPDELIDFVRKIETCIADRAKLIKRVSKRLGEKYDNSAVEEFDFMKFAQSFISNPNGENAYHTKYIEMYEEYCKTCINPLRVLTSVDHYKGYLESLVMAYQADYSKSVKFRAIKHLGNEFIKEHKIGSKTEKTSVLKGVQNFIDDYINNAYLSSKPLFKLPKSTENRVVKIIDKYGNDHILTNNDYIKLGTKQGNTTFEHFFENVFIPELKNKYKGNEFVDKLETVLVNDTNTGASYLAISLPINMMPSSESERSLLGTFTNAFTRITGDNLTIGGIDYSVMDMFHFYNLLKFRGKSGRSSLLPIFENVTARNPEMQNYRQFINMFDSTYDFTTTDSESKVNEEGRELILLDQEALDLYLAPLSNPFQASSNLIKYKDLNIGETVLLRKKEDSKNQYMDEDGEFGEYFEEYEDFDGGYDISEFMDFEEGFQDEYKPNYGQYERIDQGNLKRFDPNLETNFNESETVIPTLKVGDTSVNNVVITGGNLKSFELEGKQIKVNSKANLMKVVIQEGKEDITILNQDKLINTINQTLCGI